MGGGRDPRGSRPPSHHLTLPTWLVSTIAETRTNRALCMDVIALSLIGALSILATCTAGGAVYFLVKRPPTPTTADVERQVNTLRLAIADLTDRVEQWQKRDRVRNLRAGQEAAAPMPMDRVGLKNALRARLGGSE